MITLFVTFVPDHIHSVICLVFPRRLFVTRFSQRVLDIEGLINFHLSDKAVSDEMQHPL